MRIVLFCVCLAGVTLPLWGQNASGSSTVPGVLNTRPGSAQPVPMHMVSDVTTTTRAGKLVFDFTITVDSTFATTTPIYCEVGANLVDDITSGSGREITESAAATATRTGSTAKCTVTIPYSWSLATPSTDMVFLSYTIIAANVSTSSVTAVALRTAGQSLPSIAVPANETTHTQSIAATI